MFFGEYHCTIDDKNRLAIPAQFRDCINTKTEGKGLVISKGFDTCLAIYTPKVWQKFIDGFQSLPYTSKKVRDFQRLLYRSIQKVPNCDQQGRILIPQNLKDLATIQKNVVVVGVDTHIEVWDESKWSGFVSENEKTFEEIAEGLYKQGDAPIQKDK